MPTRFDAHCHLPATGPDDPGQIRVLCGTCEADWGVILIRATGEDRLLPMLGLHPWKVSGAAPGWADRLEALLGSHRAGLGECGLDFTRKDADRVAQEDAFRFQLRLARALRRPVAIHAVRAWGRLLPILAEEGLPGGTMIHAFSGSPELARTLQSMGIYLSFSGALLDPRRPRLREALRAVDARHLLLETDGSADLEAVLEGASEIRGVAVDDLAAQTWENGRTCFQELLA